ncbi:DUF885 domain-containing protein [Sphingosinicella rhizophila]|uniref:DUF885 domain-containing protein n=1 Tax=Sphingosinicella rhizophila TaxID=3050082 RepID=A0ABU3Q6U2_9SPHN|nr:DUF885 domain-containing protein [Sphingosinicella sp. GR2756]MDT9599116.1 DUF885 domain-containing protein [Sphingosinicella sp. GR2756]
MKSTLLLALLLTTATGAAAQQASPATTPPAAAQTSRNAEDARLLAFLDKAFDEAVATSPQTQTSLGLKSDYGKLDDYTDAYAQRMLALSEAQVQRMKAQFDFDRLSPAGQLNYRLFDQENAEARRMFEWRNHIFPMTTMGSPAGAIPVFLINQHRIDNVADAEAYIARLGEVERVMGEIMAQARAQADQGIVPPKFNFAPVRADAKRVISGAPFDAGPDSTLLADFRKKVTALDAPAEVKARLIGEAKAALAGPFKRGFDTMLATLDAIEPKAKGNDGAWSLPRGADYYAARLRAMTTTDLSADRIHQIGLDEVARIHGEMEKIKQRVGFDGTLQQFFAHIKNGQQFKYPNSDAGRAQYLKDANAFIAQVMAAAPKWFSRLPKAPLEVKAVETWRQDTAAVAFYNQPSPDGSRPGIYYVNLADMNQVLKPQIEGISYHEGAPGHHFQIALQQELEGVPKFRRFGGHGAYVEGWGLYAEKLGKEMGFYQDPYSEFGHLSLDLWRAVRLVTDTGLHAKRWSREQAIKYFQDNSLLSERDIVKEVERYINIPGQATSYKIGQLRILELREQARKELGARFDIRDFHAAVLENGSLPLDILEERVEAYIAAAKR